MSLRFSVLASGSSGNASLLETSGFGVLIDAGLGPRLLGARLAALGASWKRVHAVLLTHTHGDHWKDRTLAHLCRLRIPLYCHPEHQAELEIYSSSFADLRMDNLVFGYEHDQAFALGPGLVCRPLPLRHDGALTTGFRFETPGDLTGNNCALAYAADLGSWSAQLAQQLADVDILALEFNHDVNMEHSSGRSPQLIARVLGDHGHLSNEQAAALVAETLRRSEPGRLQHVVQLHLSRECNRPALAAAAAHRALSTARVQVHTARQYQPGPSLQVRSVALTPAVLPVSGSKPTDRSRRRRPAILTSRSGPVYVQLWLPGWEEQMASA